jgi:site-specific recombinase XerD
MIAQTLTTEEAKALIDACNNHTNSGIRDRAVFTVLWRGSMRISATLRIMPSDIDWTRGMVTIQSDKGGRGRTVVLDDQAMDVLKIWAERRKALGMNGHHRFFCGTNSQAKGNHLDPSHFRHQIKKMQAKAGIPKRCHLHGLRHTGASNLLEEGFDLATIAAQLGHAHTSTTSRYLHQLRPDLMSSKLRERVW